MVLKLRESGLLLLRQFLTCADLKCKFAQMWYYYLHTSFRHLIKTHFGDNTVDKNRFIHISRSYVGDTFECMCQEVMW